MNPASRRITLEGVRVVLACLVVLSTSGRVLADTPPSSLRVLVDGALTGSAVVTVTGSGALDRYEATVTASRRVVHLAAVRPGSYDVRLALADGRAAGTTVLVGIREAVTVVATIPADAALPPAIAGRPPTAIGDGARFDRETVRILPAGTDIWTIAETAAPFVIADRLDTGGVATGRSALLGSRGESWALTTVDAAGVAVGPALRNGQLAAAPPMIATEAVALLSGVAPVEVATPGVVVAWSPRRPAGDWTGGVEVTATTPNMVGENTTRLAPSLQRVDRWREGSAFAGGPIHRDAGLFVAVRRAKVSWLELEQPPALEARNTSVFAHVVARPSSNAQLRVTGALEQVRAPFDGRAQFSDGRSDQDGTFARAGVAWERVTSRGGRGSLAMTAQRNTWSPQLPSLVRGGVVDRVVHGVVPAPPADVIHAQWEGRANWGVLLGGGRHDIRVGALVRRSRLTGAILAEPTVGESVAGLPARIWQPVASTSDSHRTATEGAWYVADRLGLSSGISLDAGVRGEMVRASAAGATAGIRWNTLSPRASLRWQLGPLALLAGAGRYAGGHALQFTAYGDPGEPIWDVYRWLDGNQDGLPGADELGVLVARAGSGAGVGTLDPGLRVPRTTEWVVGGDVRLSRTSTLRGAIVLRRQTDLVGVTNPGIGDDAYRVSFIPDINADEGSPHDDQLLPIYERLPASFGRDALLLTNPQADPVRHDGIELTYELRSRRWMMLFGATAYRTLGRGGLLGYGPLENDALVPGDRYWNPNLRKDEDGRLFFDRAYVGKWVIAYAAPGDVSVGAVVRYQDGQPFTRYVVATDLPGGPELTQAYSVGRTRFTYTATLDVRIEKTVRLGGRRALAVRLDAFNLTNHANELAEDVLTGPTFRRSTITQPPRTLRAGLRVEF